MSRFVTQRPIPRASKRAQCPHCKAQSVTLRPVERESVSHCYVCGYVAYPPVTLASYGIVLKVAPEGVK